MKRVNYIITILLMSIGLFSISGCNENSKNPTHPNNNGIPNKESVESLEKIQLGGVEQWIYITSESAQKPVLLFLHGGPGYVMMPILHKYNRELEKYFTVVNWDQRGAGLSYSRDISRKSMNLDQFVSDLHDLTEYLKSRFNKEKIYLMGHSFGTIFGMKAVDKYPQDYWAYIGVGQVVNIVENEKLSYDFALKSAMEDNNQKALKQLNSIGRPDDNGNYKTDSGYEITMNWMEHYGGDLYGKTSTESLENEINKSDIYKDSLNKIDDGMSFSMHIFEDPQVFEIDFTTQITKVDVPVYFLSGCHDYDTPWELVEKYYNIIQAPQKEMIWFDNSSHFPFYEEPDKFSSVLIDQILPQTFGEIEGTWYGTYSIGGEDFEGYFTISKESGNYSCQFSFPAPDYNSVGTFGMEVKFDPQNKKISLYGNEWIEKPEGYEMINLEGNINGFTLSGNVMSQDGSSIGTFSFYK